MGALAGTSYRCPLAMPLAAALLLAAAALIAGQASAAPVPPAAGPPRVDEFAQPYRPPPTLREGGLIPGSGFQFGLGAHQLRVRSVTLGAELESGTPFSDGATLAVESVLGPFRVGYLREIYRHSLPEGARYDDRPVSFLTWEADELWLVLGFRPWYPLYLGYGLALQYRQSRLTPTAGGVGFDPVIESSTVSGLQIELAFSPPYALQLRSVTESPGGLARRSGLKILLTYLVPYGSGW